MKILPYRATTGTGDVFDIEFPLNPATADAVRIHQMITELLAAIDRSVSMGTTMSNGDVLQAMAMTLAIRTRMIHAPTGITKQLAQQLLATALDAVDLASRETPTLGHA